MRVTPLMLAAVLVCGACVTETQNQPSVTLAPPQVAGPDLTEARYCSRQPGGAEENPLALASLTLALTSAGHTVRSHLTMVVKNPTAAQAEAALRLPLPPGAAVSRAVLHVAGRPMEGAFVQRDRARFIYRSITERRRDPALVVWRGPEWVDVSIFPVEANGGERIFELEWIEPTAAAAGRLWYRLPVLAHRGQVVGRPKTVTVDGVPLQVGDRGWIALGGKVPTAPALARRPGDPFGLVVARDPGPAPASPGAAGPRVVVVAETSAAMTVEHRRQQRVALGALLDALPPDAKVSLMRADWSFAELTERAGADAVRQALDALDAVPSAGALDLERVLDAAADRAAADGAAAVVYIGHGQDAFGGDPLGGPLQKLAAAKVTLSAVGLPEPSAPLSDAAWLSGGRPFTAGEVRGPTLKAVITRPRAAPAQPLERVESWHPLETVTGELVWVGRFVGEPPTQGARGEPRHLEALWARGRAVGSARQLEDLGRTHRVLTPLTSILVLEKDSDYTRWGLEVPKAPEGEASAKQRVAQPGEPRPEVPRPDVSRPDVQRLEPPQRTGLFGLRGPAEQPAPAGPAAAAPLAEAARDRAVGDALGAGSLGLRGAGRGGGASEGGGLGTSGKMGGGGFGASPGGLGARRAQTPAVAIGEAEVRGSLDKEIIRRVIRMNINQVRYCYEKALVTKPGLAGRVLIQFVIAPTGDVTTARVQSSTLASAPVEQCVTAAVRRWQFPKPAGGGLVVVAYPFLFRPGEGGSTIGGPIEPIAPVAPVEDPFTKALAILVEAGTPLEGRVGRIAQTVGVAATTSAQALAWSIVQDRLRSGRSQFETFLLAALLLREAQAERDAVRVLSQGAPRYHAQAAEAMERHGWPTDAARVRALQARPGRQ